MQNLSKLLLLSASLSFVATEANASETIVINPTNKAPLFDGRCGKDEWQAATKIELPAQASIFLMHDKDSLYVCAKGKAEDYTVIDRPPAPVERWTYRLEVVRAGGGRFCSVETVPE